MNRENSYQISRVGTMVLRPALAERPVDPNASKKYILENRVSSRVFTSTIPYLSNNKESEWKSPSLTTTRKSGRSRVSFQDDVDQECCIFDPRFAPKSITKRQSSSKTKVTQTARTNQSSSKTKVTQTRTNTPPASFLNSKVFVKRLNTAAIKIQTQVRRVYQRQRYLHILITKVQKEIQALHEKAAAMILEVAATTIQALGRGGMCRLHFQLKKLEFRLLQSDRLLKTQLEDIQTDKERQMKAFYDEEKAKMEKLAKDRTDMVQNINENVKLLRKENKILRSNNKKFRRSIDVFKQLNSRLEELTAGFGVESVKLKNIISTRKKENKEWSRLGSLYEERIVKFKDLIQERTDRRICERQVAKKIRESIVNIVRVIEDEAEEEELVKEVIELGESAIVRIAEAKAEAEDEVPVTEVIELRESTTIARVFEDESSVIELGESTIARIFEDEELVLTDVIDLGKTTLACILEDKSEDDELVVTEH
jgi:hypothetical protein